MRDRARTKAHTGALLLVALVIVASGCAGALAEPTPTPAPVTLRFIFSQRAKEQKYWEAAQAFQQRYPHITVEVLRDTNILRRARQGGVDVMEAEQFDYPLLLDAGVIRDLSPYLESQSAFPLSDYSENLLQIYRDQGKTWGIPANLDPIVIFYNKDQLDRAGVPYPQVGWDWNDFLATATALSDRDALPQKYGFQPDPYGLGVWGFVYQGGGQLVDNLISPTHATLDDPDVIRAVEWYASLVSEHEVMPQVDIASGDLWQTTWTAIERQETGLWSLLLSERNGRTRRSSWPFQWGVVPLPQDKARVTFVMSSAYFVSANTQSPREAWMWLDFLATEAQLEWDVPPRRSVATSQEYRQLVGNEMFQIARETMDYGIALPAAAWLTQVPLQSASLIDDIIAGRTTAEEGLELMQKQWDAALQSLNE